MKNPILSAFIVIFLIVAARLISALPIDFAELSLLVRAHENESSIKQEVTQRKLLYPLTQQQEATLRAQGASDSLVQSLRSSKFVASQEEAAAIESRRELQRKMHRPSANQSVGVSGIENVSVFDVAVDHPVNLARWGGPDCEFAFTSQRYLGENVVTPFIINRAGTYTDVATYVAFGSASDPLTPSDYISIMSHASSRRIHIDMQNPVRIDGIPYNLYPIYAAGGVSLYFIGASTSSSVRLAVSTGMP